MRVGCYSSQAGQVFSNHACPYIDWCFLCFTFMKPDLDFVAVLLKSDIQSVVISLLGLLAWTQFRENLTPECAVV